MTTTTTTTSTYKVPTTIDNVEYLATSIACRATAIDLINKAYDAVLNNDDDSWYKVIVHTHDAVNNVLDHPLDNADVERLYDLYSTGNVNDVLSCAVRIVLSVSLDGVYHDKLIDVIYSDMHLINAFANDDPDLWNKVFESLCVFMGWDERRGAYGFEF